MRDIARLLFGDGLTQPNDDNAVQGDGAAHGNNPFGPGGGWELAERARRAGEWCGSTPGRGAIARALGDGGRPRRARR